MSPCSARYLSTASSAARPAGEAQLIIQPFIVHESPQISFEFCSDGKWAGNSSAVSGFCAVKVTRLRANGRRWKLLIRERRRQSYSADPFRISGSRLAVALGLPKRSAICCMIVAISQRSCLCGLRNATINPGLRRRLNSESWSSLNFGRHVGRDCATGTRASLDLKSVADNRQEPQKRIGDLRLSGSIITCDRAVLRRERLDDSTPIAESRSCEDN
jgi:hypothetical protein